VTEGIAFFWLKHPMNIYQAIKINRTSININIIITHMLPMHSWLISSTVLRYSGCIIHTHRKPPGYLCKKKITRFQVTPYMASYCTFLMFWPLRSFICCRVRHTPVICYGFIQTDTSQREWRSTDPGVAWLWEDSSKSRPYSRDSHDILD